MRVYVTGSNGYLGAWLVRTLTDRGHVVFGLDSHGRRVTGEGTAEEFLPTANVVAHLAWYSSAGDRHADLHRWCLDQTEQLIQQVRWQAPTHCRFLFASTASVYGDGGNRAFRETDPVVPNCAYTRAKVAAEDHLSRLLPGRYIILRLGSLMGLGLTRTKTELVVNGFASEAYTTGVIRVWNPDAWKPVLHVRDAAMILTEAADRPAWTGTVNAAAMSIQASDIARRVAQLTGARIEIVQDAGCLRSCILQCDRLVAELPEFQPVTLTETIQEFTGYVPGVGDRNEPWGVVRR